MADGYENDVKPAKAQRARHQPKHPRVGGVLRQYGRDRRVTVEEMNRALRERAARKHLSDPVPD